MFAEFPMLLQYCSHNSFLSQNNIFKQRNDLSGEKRGSAGWVGQLHAPVSAMRGISGNFASPVVSLAIPSWQPLVVLPRGKLQCAHAVHCFCGPTWKEASLAGGWSFEGKGKDAFGKISSKEPGSRTGDTGGSHWAGMQFHPSEHLVCPILECWARKAAVLEGLPDRTHQGWLGTPLTYPSQSDMQPKQCELQKQVPAAFPWGCREGW